MTRMGELSLTALCALVVTVAGVVSLGSGNPAKGGSLAVVGLVLVLLGASILVQVPGNRVGRAYVVLAPVLVVAQLVNGYAEQSLNTDPQHWLRWLVAWSSLDWLAAFGALTYVCFVFPDGASSGRRWHIARLVVLAAFPACAITHVLSTRTFDSPFANVHNPWAVATALAPVSSVALVVCGAGMVAAVGSLVVRARRATGVERLQLRWLTAGLALAPALMFACLAVPLFGAPESTIGFGFVLLLAAVPLSTVIAIRRHGLWLIDHLISTAVSWSMATAVVVATYAVVVVAVGGTSGGSSPWRVATATLAAAAVARPTVRLLQRRVDQVFDRPRARAVSTIEAFTATLQRDRVLPEDIGAVMARALGEPDMRVVYRQGPSWVEVDGSSAQWAATAHTTTVQRDGEPIALLLHESEPQRPDVVEEVVRRCRLALEAVALRTDLRAQVVEVEASRRRIISVADAERRRLERDLHDGAQQRLVALGIGLRLQQAGLVDLDGAQRALDHAVEGIGNSLQELRDLSQGLHAREVAEQGLEVALHSLAQRSPVTVTVEGTLPRLGADIESTAWFVACEAVTNATRHAQPCSIRIVLKYDGSLHVAISDDGPGGATIDGGTGLLGLTDRVAVAGGTLDLRSPLGGGTTLMLELPCAS